MKMMFLNCWIRFWKNGEASKWTKADKIELGDAWVQVQFQEEPSKVSCFTTHVLSSIEISESYGIPED